MSPSPASVRAAFAIVFVYRDFERATRSSAMNMGQYRALRIGITTRGLQESRSAMMLRGACTGPPAIRVPGAAHRAY